MFCVRKRSLSLRQGTRTQNIVLTGKKTDKNLSNVGYIIVCLPPYNSMFQDKMFSP